MEQKSGRKDPNMMIIGCGQHPGSQPCFVCHGVPAQRIFLIKCQSCSSPHSQSAMAVPCNYSQLLGSLTCLQVFKDASYTYLEKAGVGGSTPSLATIFFKAVIASRDHLLFVTLKKTNTPAIATTADSAFDNQPRQSTTTINKKGATFANSRSRGNP